MPYVDIHGTGNPIWMEDDEYRVYQAAFMEPQTHEATPEVTPTVPTYHTDAGGNLVPNSPTPYLYSPDTSTALGTYGQYGTQFGVSAAAAPAMAAAMGPWAGGVGGLWLLAGNAIMQGVHGDSWTPDKYQPMTTEERINYFLNNRNSEQRAETLTPMSSDSPHGNVPTYDMVRYMDQMPPLEDMAWYNPGTQQDKYKAYAMGQWYDAMMRQNWQGDLLSQDAAALAEKYGIQSPGGTEANNINGEKVVSNQMATTGNLPAWTNNMPNWNEAGGSTGAGGLTADDLSELFGEGAEAQIEAAGIGAEAMKEAARIAAAENERYQKAAQEYSERGYQRATGFYSPYEALGVSYLPDYLQKVEKGFEPFQMRSIDQSPYSSLYQWQQAQQDKSIKQSQAGRGLYFSGPGMTEQVKADTGLAQQQSAQDVALQRQDWLDRYGLWQTDLANYRDIANLGWQGAQGSANAALGVGGQQAGLAGQAGQTAASVYSQMGQGLGNIYSSLGGQLGQTYANQANVGLGYAGLNSSNYWNQQQLNYANAANAANRNLAYANLGAGLARTAWDAYRGYNPTNNMNWGGGSGYGTYGNSLGLYSLGGGGVDMSGYGNILDSSYGGLYGL